MKGGFVQCSRSQFNEDGQYLTGERLACRHPSGGKEDFSKEGGERNRNCPSQTGDVEERSREGKGLRDRYQGGREEGSLFI